MTCPRIEVDLGKIRENCTTVVRRLKARGLSVTGVTKAVCGHPAVAQAMLDGGVAGLAESRISNVRRLRRAGHRGPITMIRTPMQSQANQVVQHCEASYNTEIVVIEALATAACAKGKVHGILLMVEMGDQREGILPENLGAIARHVMETPGVVLKGIGANFACLSGRAPNAAQMAALSVLANETEGLCGAVLQTVSGGNSANLPWAFGDHAIGRINDLRLGEAILLGVDPVSGDPLDGMHQDAFTLVAEVIEIATIPALSQIGLVDPALAKLRLFSNTPDRVRAIVAIGHQDTDISGLSARGGHSPLGATSDHLVIGTEPSTLSVGDEVRFQMTYSALVRAMAAPDVALRQVHELPSDCAQQSSTRAEHLALV